MDYWIFDCIMEKINRFFAGVAEVCSPSKGNLSGAMDVIVIKRSDGTFSSTAFNVKFGRFKLIKSNNIKVNIKINGCVVPVMMILKKSGKGRILHEAPAGRFEERKDEPDIIISSEDEEQGVEVHEVPEVEQSEISIAPEVMKSNPPLMRNRSYRQNTGVVSSEKHMTSDELRSLNLQEGLNIIEYITQTKKNKSLKGRIFCWDDTVKIVVSDIDGTLTKSDMIGHLYYFMGKDWSREGVVSLYNEISLRNYKILYLTSRSLSQVGSTIGLLNTVDQKGAKLPQGPILLSPDGLFRSIVREISNYSQQLKETLLHDLLQNFPLDKEPYWAGFGNKMGDAMAYYNSCVDPSRIFMFTQNRKIGDCKVIVNFNEVSLNIDEHFPIIHL